jgi:glucose-6-phosphate isomerase
MFAAEPMLLRAYGVLLCLLPFGEAGIPSRKENSQESRICMLPLHQQIHPTSSHIAASAADVAEARAYLAATAREPAPSWMTICTQLDDLAEIQRVAAEFRAKCAHVVLCGTGGSSLGTRALLDICTHPLGLADTAYPTIHLLDSTEPELLEAVFALPPEKTGWLFISRSGGTLETCAQFLAYASRGMHKKSAYAHVITLLNGNPLHRLAQEYGIGVSAHAEPIGGRFSVLSNVGLLPAAIVGMDIAALRQGAASMLGEEGVRYAVEAVQWHVQSRTKGCLTHVMLPYASRLKGWTYWYRQLWAESLGKDGKGTTPLIGLGPLDQHSMLQLLLDGPADKNITTIHIAPDAVAASGGQKLGEGLKLADASLAFLAELRGEEIMHAQAYGTTHSFVNRGIPVREIFLSQLNEQAIGALFMLQMLETVLTARAYGVNAFDQPAVEESKVLAMRFLREAHAALAAS